MYWSCALAGSNPEVWQEQFTPPGQFSFNLTSKLPCTARKVTHQQTHQLELVCMFSTRLLMTVSMILWCAQYAMHPASKCWSTQQSTRRRSVASWPTRRLLPCVTATGKLPRRLLSANSDTGHPALPSGWYDASWCVVQGRH
jgi:hypothetical protein